MMMKSKQSLLNEESNLLTDLYNVIPKMKMVTMMLILLKNQFCYLLTGCKNKRIL